MGDFFRLSGLSRLTNSSNYDIFLKWSKNSLYGVIDQGLFSTSNFLINIFFGRWLSEKDYGAYAIGFTIFLILSTFQSSLIFEPMAVFGQGDLKEKGKTYFGSLVVIQFILTVIIGIVLVVASLFSDQNIKQPLIGLSVSISFILMYWYFRQACYVELRPGTAAITSLVYALINGIGLYFVNRLELFDSAIPFMMMGISSIFASTLAIALLQYQITFKLDSSVWFVIKKHWNYGKWLLASTIPNSISTFAFVPMIGVIINLQYSGAFRAIQNLILPIQQVFAVLTLLFLPRLSKFNYAGDKSSVSKYSITFFGINLAVLVVYLLLLIPLSPIILQLFYQNSFYESFYNLIPLWGLCLFLGIIIQTFTNLLRIAEKTKSILFAKIGAATCIFCFGYFLIKHFLLTGALIVIILSLFVETLFVIFQYRHSDKSKVMKDLNGV